MVTIKKDVTLKTGGHDKLALTGDITYDPKHQLLQLTLENGMPERLSIRLEGYDVATPAGHAWVKDYSEHEGFAEQLAEAGCGEVVESKRLGPFGARFHLLKIALPG